MKKKAVTTQELLEFLQENMIVRQDLIDLETRLQKDMATKQDLVDLENRVRKNMATKKDLEGFATKKDLESFATKKDIEKLATRGDLMDMKMEILDKLDEKLARAKGDTVVLVRKEDAKVVEVIQTLKDKKVIDAKEAKRLLKLEPFPQIVT